MNTYAPRRGRSDVWNSALALVVLVAGLVTAGPAKAGDPFEHPWIGYNIGQSAYPGATEVFERDPTAMTTADLDGDGWLDVAVANFEYGAPGGGTDGMSGFALLFGQGGGRFGEAQHVTVSNQGCWDIAAADFDGDGDLDIAVSVSRYDFSGTQVRVYLNDGSGGFPTYRTRVVSDGPIGIAPGDFDADGHMDLAVVSHRFGQSEGVVSILRGDGTGSLLAPTAYLVAMQPWKLEAGDLDGDGDLDLAVAHRFHEVMILSNAGDGTFPDMDSYSGFFVLQGGQHYANLELTDTDLDGDLDVLYANTRTGPSSGSTKYVVHLVNDGTGTFTRAADIPAVGAVDLSTGDLNGDGWPDIVAVEHSGRTGDGPHVVLNDGSGGFLPMRMIAAGQGTFAADLADVDGDGDLDLLSADRYSMAVTVHENPGDGDFWAPRCFEAALNNTWMDAGDVDGDGDLDVIASTEVVGFEGALLRNNGDGTFEPPVLYTHSNTYGRGVARAKLRDLDGDGDLDLLYNGAHTDFHDGYNFYTAPNDGDGNFGPITQWFIGTCGNGDVDAFDIDGDGDLDVINCEELACGTGTNTANRLYVSLNHGDGTFADAYTIQISTGPHALIGGDYNEDGHVDLITTHWMPYGDRDFINVHIGNGDGTFEEEVIYYTAQGPRWIVQDDFDGDGHMDLATANSGSGNGGRETLTVLFGTGTSSFIGRTDYYAPFSSDLLGATGLAAGDFDHDGDVDLVATTVANGLAYYENDGTGAFTFTVRYGLTWSPHDPFYADFDGDGIGDIAAVTADEEATATGSAITVLRGIEAATTDAPESIDPVGAGPLAVSPVAPNPFRSLAQFDVFVPSTQHVQVGVYDATGRNVATLHEGELEGSVRHAFVLDGKSLSSGIYFVRAQGETFEATRRAVLTR